MKFHSSRKTTRRAAPATPPPPASFFPNIHDQDGALTRWESEQHTRCSLFRSVHPTLATHPPQVLISTLLYRFAFTAWGYALVVSGCLLCVFVVQAHAYACTRQVLSFGAHGSQVVYWLKETRWSHVFVEPRERGQHTFSLPQNISLIKKRIKVSLTSTYNDIILIGFYV